MTQKFCPKAAVPDDVIANAVDEFLIFKIPAETVLAVRDDPEFVILEKLMFIVPEPEWANKPIPVVPRSPVQ